MKKGFTLIELLAVIVILAIIAVIAVPIVIDIIEEAKINSIKASANMYSRATKIFISNAELNKIKINEGTYQVTDDGNVCIGTYTNKKCDGETIDIEIKGTKPNNGNIIINENNNVEIEYLEINGYLYYKYNDEYLVEKRIKERVNSNDGVITLNSSKIPTLSNYKIYGNSYQEIRSGKNLFDIKSAEVLYKAPYGSIEKLENGYKAICNRESGSAHRIDILIPMSLFEEGKTYTISSNVVNVSNIAVGESEILSDTTSFSKFGIYRPDSATFIISNVTKPYLNLYFYAEEYEIGDVIEITNLQIEEGTVATEYEPYGVMPSPEYPGEIQSVGDLVTDENDEHYGKYALNIKVTGKNLINWDITNSEFSDQTIYNGFGYGKWNDKLEIPSYLLEKTVTYSVLVDLTNSRDIDDKKTSGKVNYWLYNDKNQVIKYSTVTDSNFIYAENKGISKTTFTIPQKTKYAGLGVYIYAYGQNVIASNPQIEFGLEATEYEPYKEEIYSIYLDEPLRCVGEVCDYIDYEKKQVVRNIKEYVVTGNEDVTISDTYFTNDILGCYFNINDRLIKSDIISNFLSVEQTSSPTINKELAWRALSVGLAINISRTNNDRTVQAWQDYFSNLYDEGNFVKLYYILEKPDVKSIELPKIYINKTVSNIIVDTNIKPNNIIIEYN